MLRLRQRFPIISFGFLLTLSAASAVFIHQVSPTRDPAFYSKPLTGGSPLPWLQGVHENTWILGASILAALLAISLTLVLRQWSQAQILPSGSQSQNTFKWIVTAVIFFMGFEVLFVFYLLQQWILD